GGQFDDRLVADTGPLPGSLHSPTWRKLFSPTQRRSGPWNAGWPPSFGGRGRRSGPRVGISAGHEVEFATLVLGGQIGISGLCVISATWSSQWRARLRDRVAHIGSCRGGGNGIMRVYAKTLLKGLILVVCAAVMLPRAAEADSAYEINRKVDAALSNL